MDVAVQGLEGALILFMLNRAWVCVCEIRYALGHSGEGLIQKCKKALKWHDLLSFWSLVKILWFYVESNYNNHPRIITPNSYNNKKKVPVSHLFCHR